MGGGGWVHPATSSLKALGSAAGSRGWSSPWSSGSAGQGLTAMPVTDGPRSSVRSRLDRSPRGLRLRVRIRRHVLDREIGSGLQPGSDAARALRARQLTSPAERCCVAAALASVLEAADERHADPASLLRLNHAEVLAARHEIVALIEALRGDRAVAPRGVALARLLVDGSGSPLLCPQRGRSVRQAVSQAIGAL